MVVKIRKDVRAERVHFATSHVAGRDSPVLATPTTTAQKRVGGMHYLYHMTLQ